MTDRSIDQVFRDFGLEYDAVGACPCGCDVFMLRLEECESECFDCGARQPLDFSDAGQEDVGWVEIGPKTEPCYCGHLNLENELWMNGWLAQCEQCGVEIPPF